jgi:hypothetical protein
MDLQAYPVCETQRQTNPLWTLGLLSGYYGQALKDIAYFGVGGRRNSAFMQVGGAQGRVASARPLVSLDWGWV